MHEFSLAQNIVEIATEQFHGHNVRKIEAIDIEIGTLSGVVKEALEFALEEAVKNTVLEKATIRLIDIQARANCGACGNTFDMNDFFGVCPACQSPQCEIISGKELKIKSLRIDY
ncbi:MAG: hydrogenase maturation nickel metallochaperone HypA [Bacteroidetes bacterium]|jgi:hydrogenase nickel incorporation protein HypA/HybF|nr:hydrogenase maturation nickel metallochaperone HypA [Bacteroidota bacterium]